MFDFLIKYIRWSGNLALKIMNLDSNPDFPKWFVRAMHWIADKFFPFLGSVTIYFVLFWILNKVNDVYGFEKAVLLGIVMLIFKARTSV